MGKCLNPVPLWFGFVPCGKCYYCLERYSTEWAVRCMDELKFHNGVGCFCTLTYAETDGNLCRRDFQLFLKRLRKRVGKIRYFGCGEYGGKSNRPHGHILIFGWRPDDLKYLFTQDAQDVFTSPFLESVWSHGFVTVGDITFRSAFYCAKYLQKLDERDHEVKPFTFMSLKPGIGYMSFDVGKDLLLEKRVLNNKSYPLPRYYIRRAEKDGFNTDIIKIHRQQMLNAMEPDIKTPNILII